MELISNSLYSSANLKAYYRFEDNAEDSKNSHDGSASNVSYTAGKYGKAGSFNGSNSAITITNHADLRPTGAFSIGCWVKTSQSSSDVRVFCSSEWSGSGLAGIELCIESGKPRLLSFDGSGTTEGTDYKVIVSSIDVSDNVWHLIIGTWDTSKLYIYVDLNAANSVSWAKGAGYQATNYVTIGRRTTSNGGSANYYSGLIDDAFLINGYAMTASDVANLYSDAFIPKIIIF